MTAPAYTITPLQPGKPRPLFMRYIKLEIKTGSGAAETIKSFECAVTNAGITSTGGDAQTLNTLCPDGAYQEVSERTYSVAITGVQDVETQESFMLFLYDHDGETAELTFYPKVTKDGTPVGRGWKATVTIAPPDTIGGADSGTYATFQATLPCTGKPQMIDDQGNLVNQVPTGVTAGSPGAFVPPEAVPTNLTTLRGYGSLGQTAAWTTDPMQWVVLGDGSGATWDGIDWQAYVIPMKGQASPGSWYAAEPTITAEDATNAAKLTGLGYVAVPTTAWVTGEAIHVGTYDFHWDGAAWAAGEAL